MLGNFLYDIVFWGIIDKWFCKMNLYEEISLFKLILINKSLGGCCGSRSKKTRVGGWAWAWWLVTDVQRLSLEVSRRI